MEKRFIVIFFLVSLFVVLFVAFSAVLVLKIRDVENGSTLYCATLTNRDEIFSDSINSIYNVPVHERWRIHDDGAIEVVEVVSSAGVMEYYHLDDYTNSGDGAFRGIPKDLIYHDVLLKVGTRGQQRLIVRGQEIALYRMVPEATTLEITIQRAPRLLACL